MVDPGSKLKLAIAGHQMPDLIAFLHDTMSKPFSLPENDCCFTTANWIRELTGIDPAADLRGTYGTESEARRIVARWGGFLTMWKVHMALAGFSETRAPIEGDVGVVRDAAGQIVSAIRVTDGWAAKTKGGLVIEEFAVLCAWSVVRG